MDLQGLQSQLTTTLAGPANGSDLGTTLRTALALLQDPSKNPRLALLILSCLVLLVLMLAVIVLFLFTPSRKRVIVRRTYSGEFDEAPELEQEASEARPPKPTSRLFLALTGPVAVAVLVVIGLAGLYATTSTDAYCARTCHAQSSTVIAAAETSHASCIACHERSGLFGVLPNVVARVRMAVNTAADLPMTTMNASADSRGCLDCHSDVAEKVVTSATGTRVSHRELLTQGMPCVECHPLTGHTRRSSTSMSECVGCHDAKQASAGCSTCHSKDPVAATFASGVSSRTVGSGRIIYPPVRAASRDCGGCHDQTRECDGCHGIRMPHTAGFIATGHARAAAFGGKVVCFRCHAPADCGACHTNPFDPKTGLGGHPGDWARDHGRSSWKAGCVCHQGRSARTQPICVLCHDLKTHALLPIRP